ncbi:MAG: hypothetical protein Q9M35_04665 [Rhodothermus sp.]|nr:hypothetical protein [Rhodothermus sp.]
MATSISFGEVSAYNAAGESAPSNQVSTYGAPFSPPYSLEVLADSLRLVQWVPEVFAVRMVGPQPFTYKTMLEVDLPEAVQVRLVVYDMLGREVARPVEGYYRAGRHWLQIVGSGWPAGVYVYRLEAGRWLHSGTFVRQ